MAQIAKPIEARPVAVVVFFFYLVVGVVCLLFCISGFLRKIQNLFELVKNRLAWWLSDCLWKDQSSAKPIVAYFCQQNRYQFMQLASPVNSAKRNRENEWLCISLSACLKMSMRWHGSCHGTCNDLLEKYSNSCFLYFTQIYLGFLKLSLFSAFCGGQLA